MDEIAITPLRPDAFDEIIGPTRAEQFACALKKARDFLRGHTLWHLNSAAEGGGVAEMLRSVLSYVVGADIRCRWLVIDGSDDFFVVTKRIHHLLHGEPGDGGDLDNAAREIYEQALAHDGKRIGDLVSPGDVVILHDPQTLGLAPLLRRRGARLIWSCHVGADTPDDRTRLAWSFLLPYVEHTERQVFSRPDYAWESLARSQVSVIPPCLDVFSAKNQNLDDETAAAILAAAGIVRAATTKPPAFVRHDLRGGLVSTSAEMIEMNAVPPDAAIVTQISRWDPLKGHIGVMAGFVRHVPADSGAVLVLAGPAADSVSDDPESHAVLDDVRRAWEELPEHDRARVHLACLPMDDAEQNAAIVNALQRRSSVVVQKSVAEGFGLTVAEAMWKGRPTIGSRVGGIQDQIEHGRSGLLLDDPEDVDELGRAVAWLLANPEASARMGAAAHAHVARHYLAPEHLTSYLELVTSS